ncbi:hypothetical protein A2757_00190 [Candidatus Giovannonibacteria bacterium RIFCSPHIGHO2_01_FULL_48_47]|nr:MAG: hypothetical protein A2757_00190 [Candidatus Giovannonibacteria bacterium RIFCSPHIGHO2_01_FULL_48_47]OGF68910.1 MAG: hypothetical protein A3D61_03185 [Candidatus Giovannonibacteria bacterium RIFCSPHIGHO2_02_FULL_48_15]OGF88540.1 MAG: hypothetical protein A3B26_00115 [Candidatus Giovannonibacteria bacterium RIFCSPLOWO2_01_FULL_48_47]OGF95494.1 MAG: hypothetical protein A2433_01695 [Candidatus Giovannonibacteria bacterium RIFOXYC1_FULL_48_8]OGF96425.1 MAG: hypothetical protein A2613_02605
MPVIRSAGAIVFRETKKGREYLLIKHAPPYGHWDFPKGHIEKREKTEEAVRREVEEETGISKIEIIPGFKETIRYFVKYTGEKALKFVAYFLAKTNEKKVKLSHEHEDFAWLPFEEAYKKITYNTSKKLLKKADEFLEKSS